MANVFFYEPFYDFERLINQALSPRTETANAAPNQQHLVDGAVKSFKPRYYPRICLFYINQISLHPLTEWMFTKIRSKRGHSHLRAPRCLQG
jgi:hypothetical protein